MMATGGQAPPWTTMKVGYQECRIHGRRHVYVLSKWRSHASCNRLEIPTVRDFVVAKRRSYASYFYVRSYAAPKDS